MGSFCLGNCYNRVYGFRMQRTWWYRNESWMPKNKGVKLKLKIIIVSTRRFIFRHFVELAGVPGDPWRSAISAYTYAGQTVSLHPYCFPSLHSWPPTQHCRDLFLFIMGKRGGRFPVCIVAVCQHFLLSLTDLFSTSCLRGRPVVIPRVVVVKVLN